MTTLMDVTGTKPRARTQTARWLALGTIAGPVLFNIAWIVLGPLRPGYSTVNDQVSALAIGPNGGYMRAAFILDALLVGVGVIAVFQGLVHDMGAARRWVCVVLLAISPFGLLWAGIFTMDHLTLHTVGAQLGLATPVITFPIVGFLLRSAPSWRRFGTWMLLGGPLTLILLVGFITAEPLSQMRAGIGGGNLGLWQRALGNEVEAWFAVMGWLGFRRSRRTGHSVSQAERS